ncbi:MAG TPA: hypothetical protein DEP63_01965 [Candidatus Magasanikbacteria bacterium]|uniref:Uncharacterized protein n=1 Tax=Candidatus Magasanikbacteria bacterium GW2011_GWE2_42_7 TaxID=1619052 RepID=A0A0G1BDA4_9BACT|nr:MAG: hypothetical protein UV42_C0031G0004 [Candidatus Magasanikbacteria bacterium GW2011_GWE2_42_7]HBB37839.1 hypothetical protein [Candidatus Magasanikbacteria bacterium]HCC13490.1 hypothetical protein [Candidatus Magasanikbacteria bacterium]
MHRFIIAFVLMLVALISSSAEAKPFVDRPRIRMIMHAERALTQVLTLKTMFVPGGNLVAGLSPVAEIGVNGKVLRCLSLEFMAAMYFTPAEPAIAIRPAFNTGDFWAWADLEVQAPSADAYWFAQAQITLGAFVEVGVEGEGWGTFGRAKTWSNGVGPNMLLHFSKQVEVDVALHIRHTSGQGGGWKLDPNIRFHIFL